jgi:Xaa-Pro dipeptidase
VRKSATPGPRIVATGWRQRTLGPPPGGETELIGLGKTKMTVDDFADLVFPREEFAARVSQTRNALEARQLDAGVFFSAESIYYLTGYDVPSHYGFQLLVVPVEKEPFVVTRQHMLLGFQTSSWVTDYVTFPDGADPVEVTCRALTGRRLGLARLGLEETAHALTSRTASALRGALSDACFGDCSGIVDELRLVKSVQEIEYIRRAARVSDAGMEAARAAMHEGASEQEIAAEILYRTALAGGEQQAVPVLVGTQERTRLAMPVPTSRRLNTGEICWVEVFGTVRRYAAGLKAVFGVAPASRESEHRLKTALLALWRGIESIAPGKPASVVSETVQETFRAEGYPDSSYHQSGYSIGIAIPPNPHEARMLSLRRGNSTILQEGMTLHPIANLYGDGPFMGVSQTVVVTGTGSEILTTFRQSANDLFR